MITFLPQIVDPQIRDVNCRELQGKDYGESADKKYYNSASLRRIYESPFQ